MKGGKIELTEAHKSVNGAPFHCCLLWDGSGERIVTAGSDSTVVIHRYPLSSSDLSSTTLRQHNAAVTALALSPNSCSLASASRTVKIFTFPDGEFERDISRFSLSIRSLAFNKSGSLLAAAGDDDGIRVIATIDGSMFRVLKGHKGPVTDLAFDPKDEYLASIDGFGTVIFWELSSGKQINILEKKAPNNGLDMTVLNGISWRPDGEMLAVPGLKNEVVMYDRDTAEKLFSLKGGHLEQVTFMSWSPNGSYLATCGIDKQVFLWDVEQKQDIDKRKFESRICYMAWKPKENGLAVIDVMGKVGVWESAVPSHMKSPVEGAVNRRSSISDLFPPDEEDNNNNGDHSGSLDQVVEDENDSGFSFLKKLKKKTHYKDDSDDDNSAYIGSHPRGETHKKATSKAAERGRLGSEEIVSLRRLDRSKTKMQAAFQPGSTPIHEGKRHFLCYNMIGSVTSFKNEESAHIEVDFHDTGRGYRVPSMTDYFGFTMSALSDNGCVFANPQRGEKNPSTLMYRPFSSWANNSEWSMRFDAEEEVKNVALGDGWVAAVTSLNFLRVFTEGGLQKYILSVEGPPLTTAGHKDQLVVVTHASECLSTGDQVLEFKWLNISNKTLIMKDRLPVTPGSNLSWLGFSEEGLLASYDSKGILRVLMRQYANSWVPVFSAMNELKNDATYNWVVGLNATKVFCVVCNSPDNFPQVAPKPVLTPISLACPLAASDLGADELEKEFMINNLFISQTEERIVERTAAGLDISSQEDEVFNIEASLDRCILRLISCCCKGDKLVRATELARYLSLEKSLNGAIKLVTAMKLPVLAERFSNILEERLLAEAADSVPTAVPREPTMHASEPPKRAAAVFSDTLALPPAPPQPPFSQFSPPSLPSPVFSKIDVTKVKDEASAEKAKTSKCASESSSKVTADPTVRPSNPFAKKSNVQERSSLLDSIKQMAKADHSTNKLVDDRKRKENGNCLKDYPKPKKQTKR